MYRPTRIHVTRTTALTPHVTAHKLVTRELVRRVKICSAQDIQRAIRGRIIMLTPSQRAAHLVSVVASAIRTMVARLAAALTAVMYHPTRILIIHTAQL